LGMKVLDLHLTTIHFTGVASLNATVTVFPALKLYGRQVRAK